MIGVIIGLLSLFIWYFSALAIDEEIVAKNTELIVEAVIIISAAFFGSFSAFRLNNYRENRSVESKRILSLKTAVFILARQANTLGNEKLVLRKYEGTEEKYFDLPSKVGSIYSELKINLNELSFLLNHPDQNLLFDLAIEQDRFSAALEAINLRSDYHYNYVQPALRDKPHLAMNPRFIQLSATVGPAITEGIKNTTDNVYQHVYETLASINEMQERLAHVAHEMFPNERFILARTNV